MFNFLPQNISNQETTDYGFSGYKLPNYGSNFKLPSVGTGSTNLPSTNYGFTGSKLPSYGQSAFAGESFNNDIEKYKKYFAGNFDTTANMPNPLSNSTALEGVGNAANTNTKGITESMWDRFINAPFLSTIDPKTNQITQGTGNFLLSGLNSAMNMFMGLKSYNLMKQQVEMQKREYEKNFQAKQQMVNSAMEDRQKARVASNPNAYMNVNDYMNKYGIK